MWNYLIIGLFLLLIPNAFISFHKLNDYVIRLFLGVFNILLILTILAVSIPQQYSHLGITIAVTIMIIILVSGLKNLLIHFLSHKNIRDWLPVAIIVSAFSIVARLSPTGIRYHSSPDNHGFAATVGYFIDHFSISALSQDFQSATGLTNNAFYGQPTPKLESVWHIPDVQLRFAADNVFQVGRISTPLLGAVLAKLLGARETVFPWYLLFFTYLGAWITGYLMIKITTHLSTFLISGEFVNANLGNEPSKKRSWMRSRLRINLLSSSSTTYVLSTILSLSTWAQIFVFEGTLNQMWFYCALLATMYLTLIKISKKFQYKLKFKREHEISFLLVAIPSLALSTFYPNGVFLLLFQGMFLFTIVLSQSLIDHSSGTSKISRIKTVRNDLLLILVYSVAALVISLALIRDTFYIITKNFLQGAPNQPYSLGMIPFDKLFSFTSFNLSFDQVSGFGTGFSPLPSSVFRAALPLICISILIVICMLRILFRNRRFFSLPVLICLLYSFFFLLLPMHSLWNSSEQFWPYQYFRNLVNVFVLSLPILVAVVNSLVSRKSINKWGQNSVFIASFLVFLLALSAAAFLQRGKNFQSNSEAFISIKNIDIVDFSKRPFFVANDSYHQTYQLTLFGPVFNLTDNWEPEFSVMTSRPIYAVIPLNKKEFELKLLGETKIDKPFKGPIYLKDIIGATK